MRLLGRYEPRCLILLYKKYNFPMRKGKIVWKSVFPDFTCENFDWTSLTPLAPISSISVWGKMWKSVSLAFFCFSIIYYFGIGRWRKWLPQKDMTLKYCLLFACFAVEILNMWLYLLFMYSLSSSPLPVLTLFPWNKRYYSMYKVKIIRMMWSNLDIPQYTLWHSFLCNFYLSSYL